MGCTPLKFINIQLSKGSPPLEFIFMGSSSKIHQHTASKKGVRLQNSSTKKGYSINQKGFLPLWTISIDLAVCTLKIRGIGNWIPESATSCLLIRKRNQPLQNSHFQPSKLFFNILFRFIKEAKMVKLQVSTIQMCMLCIALIDKIPQDLYTLTFVWAYVIIY